MKHPDTTWHFYSVIFFSDSFSLFYFSLSEKSQTISSLNVPWKKCVHMALIIYHRVVVESVLFLCEPIRTDADRKTTKLKRFVSRMIIKKLVSQWNHAVFSPYGGFDELTGSETSDQTLTLVRTNQGTGPWLILTINLCKKMWWQEPPY